MKWIQTPEGIMLILKYNFDIAQGYQQYLNGENDWPEVAWADEEEQGQFLSFDQFFELWCDV
jgi:hypothetical protein